MALFLSSVTSKVDKKGRVLVPSNFRATLKADGHNSFIAFPSFNHRGLECWTLDRIEQVSQALDELNPFSEERDAFSSILADAQEVTVDNDGRAVLPENLVAYMGAAESVVFVGQGGKFYIWEPDAYEAFRAEQRDRAKTQRENFHWGRRPDASGAMP